MNHAHHYVLPEPNGEFCTGTCKACGAQRTWRTAGWADSPVKWNQSKKRKMRQLAGTHSDPLLYYRDGGPV